MRRRENAAGKTGAVLSALAILLLAGCQSTAGTEISEEMEILEEREISAEEVQNEGEDAQTQAETVQPQNMPDIPDEEENTSEDVGQDQQRAADDVEQTKDSESSSEKADAGDDTQNGDVSLDKKQPPEGWELTLASEDWGLSFGEPGAQSAGNASAEDLAWYDAYYVGDDDEKVIYLTFDCGYENGNTEPILDALKKHNVQAAFFVVGHFLETAPDLVKRMVEEGHAVGNHTYHHPDMSAISDQAAFRKEMDDVAELFQEITGKELSPYYRPPQGKCNAANLRMAQELGYNTIFWSLAYVDWNQDNQPTREEAFDKLTTRVHPGAVVLLHNTSQTNGEILDELLTKWEEMGYSFRPLADLTAHAG